MANYPLKTNEDIIYMSEDLNPYTFYEALLNEEMFPLERNFLVSLIVSRDITSHLADFIKNNDVFDKGNEEINLQDLVIRDFFVMYFLFFTPENWEIIAREIYNFNVSKVKPTLKQFADSNFS